jgi:CubicO group peptidase (beta-lactamase class C family)
MKKIIALIFILSTTTVSAQKRKLPATMAQLIDSIDHLVREDHMTGLMLGITTRDSVLFSGGFGWADLQAKRPVTPQTLFRMGSVTKSFVAIGILRLVEEGRLNLNDCLHSIAPELPFENPWESKNPVRIINLLEHTTGFDDMKLNEVYSLERKDFTSEEMMRFQTHSMICRWPPGEKETYCNVNYVILGYIIRKITGLEYGRYLTETLLTPLGMRNSDFNLYSEDLVMDTREYIAPGGQVKLVPSVTVLIGAAGSLWSSADDMIKFLQFFLRNGTPLLSENSLHEMETPHSSLAARAGLRTGYAIANEDGHYYNKYSWRGHEGQIGACNSHFLYNRQLGVGFVLSCNGNSSIQKIEYLICDYLEQAASNQTFPSTILVDLTTMTPYLGLYQSAAPRFQLFSFLDMFMLTTVEKKGCGILLSQFGHTTKLLSITPYIFKHENANSPTIVFTKNADGKRVMELDGVYCERVNPIWAYGKICITVIILLFAAGSFILALTGLIQFFRGKTGWQKMAVLFLPAVSVTVIVWTCQTFSKVFAEGYLLYQFRYPSARSLALFTGTTLFGLLSVLGFALVIRTFSQWRSRFTAWWLLLTALSLIMLTIGLACTGFLGIRTWTL